MPPLSSCRLRRPVERGRSTPIPKTQTGENERGGLDPSRYTAGVIRLLTISTETNFDDAGGQGRKLTSEFEKRDRDFWLLASFPRGYDSLLNRIDEIQQRFHVKTNFNFPYNPDYRSGDLDMLILIDRSRLSALLPLPAGCLSFPRPTGLGERRLNSGLSRLARCRGGDLLRLRE